LGRSSGHLAGLFVVGSIDLDAFQLLLQDFVLVALALELLEVDLLNDVVLLEALFEDAHVFRDCPEDALDLHVGQLPLFFVRWHLLLLERLLLLHANWQLQFLAIHGLNPKLFRGEEVGGDGLRLCLRLALEV
jgi:hypothetical protein